MKEQYVAQATHLMGPLEVDVRGGSASSGTPYTGDLDTSPKLAKRGTTNKNARGGSEARRRRREWLVQTYRANKDVVLIELFHGPLTVEVTPGTEGGQPACRCYRCGLLLTADTVTVDRIKPGCQGGTYVRANIRPACGPCNSETGGAVRAPGAKRQVRGRLPVPRHAMTPS